MYSFNATKIVNFPADLVYNIVLDIEKYPDFLPWCRSATIISRMSDYFIAELVICFKGITEKYRSKVIYNNIDNVYTINVEGISSPFKSLKNIWRIKDKPDQLIKTEVYFDIRFEFQSKLLNMFIGKVFSMAMQQMIDAFSIRAKYLSNSAVTDFS